MLGVRAFGRALVHVNRDGRIAGDRWIERWASVDGCDFGPRANEGVHFVAERLLEVSGDLGFKGNGVGCAGGENHIATGDEGFDVGEFKGLKAGTQDIHFDPPVAEIEAAEKGDELGHVALR